MRILFFGMLGTLSSLPLLALLKAKMDVIGLVLPMDRVPPYLLKENGRKSFQAIDIPQTPLNLLSPQITTLEIAAKYQLPLYAVSDFYAQETVQSLNNLAPDLICVSCFSKLLPSQILEIPAKGCLNVHPSLLPQLRGSAPLFWTFQKGIQQTGVTVHQMDARFDTGDVMGQRPFTFNDGLLTTEAELQLGTLGGDLLVDVVTQIANGTSTMTPQPEGYQADPWPTDADFVLDLNWSAQRAFNFMRGTMGWKRPYFINIDDRKHYFQMALGIEAQQRQNRPLVQEGDRFKVQFSDGVLVCK